VSYARREDGTPWRSARISDELRAAAEALVPALRERAPLAESCAACPTRRSPICIALGCSASCSPDASAAGDCRSARSSKLVAVIGRVAARPRGWHAAALMARDVAAPMSALDQISSCRRGTMSLRSHDLARRASQDPRGRAATPAITATARRSSERQFAAADASGLQDAEQPSAMQIGDRLVGKAAQLFGKGRTLAQRRHQRFGRRRNSSKPALRMASHLRVGHTTPLPRRRPRRAAAALTYSPCRHLSAAGAHRRCRLGK